MLFNVYTQTHENCLKNDYLLLILMEKYYCKVQTQSDYFLKSLILLSLCVYKFHNIIKSSQSFIQLNYLMHFSSRWQHFCLFALMFILSRCQGNDYGNFLFIFPRMWYGIQVRPGDINITAKFDINPPNQPSFRYVYEGTKSVGVATPVSSTNPYTYNFNLVSITSPKIYYIVINLQPCTLTAQIFRNGILNYTIGNITVISQTQRQSIYTFNINQNNKCKKVSISSDNTTVIDTLYVSDPTASMGNTFQTNYTYKVKFPDNTTYPFQKLGTWAIIANLTFSVNSSYQAKALITLKCITEVCGDSVKSAAQQCDNGNTTGCINCTIGTNFECTGTDNQLSVCNCKSGYVLDQGACKIDCTLIQYSTSRDPNNVNACICPSPFNFDLTLKKCVINCPSVSNATGPVVGSTDSCACHDLFYWQDSTKECIINCSKINNAAALASPSTFSCTCKQLFEWDITTSSCVINCSKISNTNGPVSGSIDACACRPPFEWQAPILSCVIKCGSISDTAGPVSGSIDACTCNQPYAWQGSNFSCVPNCPAPLIFNETMKKCVVNCSNINYTTGLAPNSTNVCKCIASFIWQTSTSLCVINCAVIPNTVDLAVGKIDACACRNDYFWDPPTLGCLPNCPKPFALDTTLKQCVLVCNGIQNAYTLPNGNCACKKDFTWRYPTVTCVRICTLPLIFNETLSKCVVNCSNINKAISLVDGTTDTCTCQQPLAWRLSTSTCVGSCPGSTIFNATMQKCVINCKAINNTIRLLDGSTNTCVCRANFQWLESNSTCVPNCTPPFVFNETTGKCALNCSSYPNTIGTVANRTDACICKLPYVWRTTFNCVPSCPAYTIFNQTLQKCVINCLLIKNSAGLLDGTNDTCNCQSGYTWTLPATPTSRPTCSLNRVASSSYSPSVVEQTDASVCQNCNLQSSPAEPDPSVWWVVVGVSVMTVAALVLICYVKIWKKPQVGPKLTRDDASDKENVGSSVNVESGKSIKKIAEDKI